ncbi:family 43 glycosylhydrolase [Cohnella sp. CFH 77786]|uniref:glycoside hydrolase family 43 protein n=1 Tax=Cohnella sp. CFH 77786 TaxID=2662265 RepID=UPI001C610CB3|nr:glycoside hydrolase family 43 protein [Cohnella sp. CFH 77786]MBW5445175.1 family 43 glycosylhydrolase [Cohnella sp. CFH 77786]
MSNHEPYAGYLFVYFTDDEGEGGGEEIYFALSKGNDPLHWRELNGGKPVLVSQLGEKGVRDPFLIRSPQGDKFFLLGTDLKAHGTGDWHRAVNEGSRSILVWESHDLIHWSEQRRVEIAPPEAGCAWAPEAIYDADSGQYWVYWASMLGDQESEGGKGLYHRILAARTKDFVHFTEPEVYIDYGHSVIDTTMIQANGKLYRFSKGEGSSAVFQESGDSLYSQSFTLVCDNIGQQWMKRGEGPLVFKSNVENKWYLFIDEYGFRGYIPLVTTDLDSGVWTMPTEYALPAKPRHGSVLPVTRSEYERLLADKFQSG